jgi:hypothetical protein
MFAKAVSKARRYTWPIIISTRTLGGTCSSGIGACVVVNKHGWIITAAHILLQMQEFYRQVEHVKSVTPQSQDNRHERRRKDKLRSGLSKKLVQNASAWWGKDGIDVKEAAYNKVLDIAVAKLEPFDETWVTHYPTFKDPSVDFDPGRSVCRLGYPFHDIKPDYIREKDQFELPPNSVPLPVFPNEGIVSRFAEMRDAKGNAFLFPAKFLETSSPSLRGQSGGPIFDVDGIVWAIQSRTHHYALGFDPQVPGKKGQTEHQFLNVGIGVHPESIFHFLDERNIEYSTP